MRQRGVALLIFVILIALAGVVLLITLSKPKFSATSGNPTETPFEIEATPTPEEVSDWTTYTSTRFNYTFSYPDNWHGLFFNEADKTVLFGVHTMSNYDFDKVEQFMDHGMVDWQKFIGEQIAIKFDLSVQDLEDQSKEEFLQKTFGEGTKQPKSDLLFGSLDTVQYNTPSALTDQLVRSYIAFYGNRAIVANIYVTNQPNQVVLTDSGEWQELQKIFSNFKFY